MNKKNFFKTVDHFVITTANMEKTIAFYEKVGFDVQDSGGRYEMFAGNFKINVHYLGQELEPHATNVKTGSADFCIELDVEMEMFVEHLTNEQLEILEGPVTRHGVKGKMASVYLNDPDGNLVEFCSYE